MSLAERTLLTHEPRQARSRETLRRIVAATLELARTSLDGEFTLRDVADVAGIAQGTLHARFPSKEELLVYVHEIFWNERLARIRGFFQEHTASEPARVTLTAGIGVALAEIRESAAVSHVFAQAMVDSRRLASRHQHFQSVATRLVCDEVHRRTGASDKRVRFAIRLVVSALRAQHPALDNPETRFSDAELVPELEHLVLRLVDL
jgi:AcrR family transcriptional regulator